MGYSRQYYYKHVAQEQLRQAQALQVKELLHQQRKHLPCLGGKKLYHQIKADLQAKAIKMGRDKVFEVLRQHALLIKPKRRYVQTTMSKHWLRKYPNLIKGLAVTAAEQVWVSDITYIKTDEGTCYLNLVTDAYSRKIMGYALAATMEARDMKQALVMALKNRSKSTPLIHHSDRGLQYCSAEYVSLAQQNQITISMTEQADPYENALAERMNRTMKEEFGLGTLLPSRKVAKELVEQAVYLYNHHRPHGALSMKTPHMVHT